MAFLTFAIGLIVLFKGSFQLGNRTIPFALSRSIALILMAPLVLQICAGSLLAISNPDFILSMVSEDGTLNLNSEAFNSFASWSETIQLILVLSSLTLVGVCIYNAPKTNTVPTGEQKPRAAAGDPNIMTVAEAAAYMRVSESDVLELIEQGRLGAARIGSSYRIARIAIDDFMGRG